MQSQKTKNNGLKGKISAVKANIQNYSKNEENAVNNANIEEIAKTGKQYGSPLPLSYSQLCFWFVYFALGETANNLSRLLLEGEVDVDAAEESIRRIIDSHDSLRVKIGELNPVQKIQPADELNLTYKDIRNLTQPQQNQLIESMVIDFMAPFDLRDPPLIRVALYRLETNKYLLLSCFPHIVLDGGGLHIYEKEFSDNYHDIVAGTIATKKREPLQIADYVLWERDLGRQVFAQQQNFWVRSLYGYERAQFPTHFVADSISEHYDRLVEIPPHVMRYLSDFGKEKKATLQMCLIGIIGAVISKVTGSEKVIINSVLENRIYKGTDSLLAPLLSVIPIPIHFDANESIDSAIKQTKAHFIKAYENNNIPLSVAQGIVARKRWKTSYSLLVKAIDLMSVVYARLCKRAKLYPSFLSDYLLTSEPPKKMGEWIFSGKKTSTNKGVSDPVINVNILQSFFKNTPGSPKDAPQAVKICPLTDSEKYLPNIALDGNWESDSINFYVTAVNNSTAYIRIICCCLNESGITSLQDSITALFRDMKAPGDNSQQQKTVIDNSSL